MLRAQDADAHDGWVTNVRFSPTPTNPVIVSCGTDRLVKVWNLSNCKLKANHHGHHVRAFDEMQVRLPLRRMNSCRR